MSDITILFKDELRCILQCERSIEYGIKKRFSFMADNYKYAPAYKAGIWDGSISLYNLGTKEFYVGLIPELIKWAKETGYTISFNSNDKKLFAPSLKYNKNYFTDIVPKIAKFPPKEYQIKYVEEALTWNKLGILSPTGSGKSFTMYLLIRYILMFTDYKILINVPSISLVEQLFADFKDYTIDGWDIESDVTKVYGTQKENINARIVISTWQTSAKKDQKYMNQFDAYMCDEMHNSSSKELTKIIDKLSHAPIRIGLTGTIKDSNLHELEMIARFGRLFRVVTTADLMESKDLAQLKVNFLKLKYPLEECKLITKKSTEYQQEIDYIVDHEKRNETLIKLGLNQNKNTLMLFNYVDRHGKKLYDKMISQCIRRGKKLFFISGDIDPDKRESIRLEMEECGKKIVGYDVKINGITYNIKYDTNIKLSDGTFKKINDITSNDDIDDDWFNNNKYKFNTFE